MDHRPHTGVQPVCSDHLTVSRARLQRLRGLADEYNVSPAGPAMANFADGACAMIDYLLNPDRPDGDLAVILGLRS